MQAAVEATKRPWLRLNPYLPVADWRVLLVASSLLGAGAAYSYASRVPARWMLLAEGSVRLELPAGWSLDSSKNVYSAHPPSLGDVSPTLQVRALRLTQPHRVAAWLDLMAERAEQSRAMWGAAYRVLRSEEKKAFGKHPSLWTYFSVVRDPDDAVAGAAVLPVVVVGVDIVVATREGNAYHIAAWAPAPEFEDPKSDVQRLLGSLQIIR